LDILEMGVSRTICPSLSLTMILPISASQVARITASKCLAMHPFQSPRPRQTQSRVSLSLPAVPAGGSLTLELPR
jgi:hypothetical protein